MQFTNVLLLSSNRKAWKMSSTHGTEYDRDYKDSKSNPGKNREVWDSVWKRDNFTCYYCNFRSTKYQEIHHLNQDHDDNSPINLVTVCPFCHQSFHLDTAGNTGGSKIIWLPEFSQQELNYLLRGIFIAIHKAEEAENKGLEVPGFAKIARMLESSLAERTLILEQQFKNNISDPSMLANVLINLPEEKYKNRESFLSNFKLLHARARFPVQIKYWADSTYKDLPIETWLKLLKNQPV